MKPLEINIDPKWIKKELNRYNYILAIIVILFCLIDVELIKTEPFFEIFNLISFKVILIIIQISLIFSTYKWIIKKNNIVTILSHGKLINGIIQESTEVRSKNSHIFIHLIKYKVDERKYEVTLHNKKKDLTFDWVIYEINKPTNSIIFEDLNPKLQKAVRDQIKID